LLIHNQDPSLLPKGEVKFRAINVFGNDALLEWDGVSMALDRAVLDRRSARPYVVPERLIGRPGGRGACVIAAQFGGDSKW